MYEDTDPRRDVHIDSERYDLFKQLQNSEDSPFYQAENHDLFMFTVGYGRQKAMPQSTENEEHAFFGRSRLSESQQTVLEAVAVNEESDVQVLRDQRLVYEIAEEYANAGVKELYGRVFGPKDDPLSELTLEVKDIYKSEV
ncbi:hypothetical protein V5735_19060 [Haladaptatus sp. SPP-AMP-3]|uniref:hypothetical protein n=1 Tax=Haladaptatus sp. SPP-AMP-3 TaxID=3121295 RepID=UPI003C2E3EEF